MSVTLDQVLAAVNKLAQTQKDMMHEQHLLREEVRRLQHDEEVEKNETHHLIPIVQDMHQELRQVHYAVQSIHHDLQRHFHANNMEDED